MRRIAFFTLAALSLAACSSESTAPDSPDLAFGAALTGTALTIAGGYEADIYQTRLFNGLPDSLKLSADQEARIRALVVAFEAATKADRDALNALLRQAGNGGRPSREAMREALTKGAPIIARLQAAGNKLKADIDAILTAEQRAWIAANAPKRCRPDQFPALSDAQKAQIRALEQSFQNANKADLDAVKAAFEEARGKSREDAAKILERVAANRARLESARKQLREAISGVLTPEQKASGCLPLG